MRQMSETNVTFSFSLVLLVSYLYICSWSSNCRQWIFLAVKFAIINAWPRKATHNWRVVCEQALLFGRAKRAGLSRVYFSRYSPNGELARRLLTRNKPILRQDGNLGYRNRFSIKTWSKVDTSKQAPSEWVPENCRVYFSNYWSSNLTNPNQKPTWLFEYALVDGISVISVLVGTMSSVDFLSCSCIHSCKMIFKV